jgi:hypothetical protein
VLVLVLVLVLVSRSRSLALAWANTHTHIVGGRVLVLVLRTHACRFALSKQARHEEAEAINLYVYEVQNRVLGHTHRDTLLTANNLALSMSKRGKHELAEAMCRRVATDSETVHGASHVDTLNAGNSLASILFTSACAAYRSAHGDGRGGSAPAKAGAGRPNGGGAKLDEVGAPTICSFFVALARGLCGSHTWFVWLAHPVCAARTRG